METLAHFRAHYRDRFRRAARWKDGGGKVVGYLCDNVPEELISAAGFFPLRVSGAPSADVTIVQEKVDTLYPPENTVRPGFVTSLLSRLLDGTYGFLDFLIVPHNRTAIQAIYRELKDAKAADPGLQIPEIHYLDRAWSPLEPSEVFNSECILSLMTKLETWSGSGITEDVLAREIADANQNRALLRRVQDLRTSRPSRLSGVDALQIIGSSTSVPKAEHNELLRAFLTDAPRLVPRGGPRIFFGGSPQDHILIYEAIEAEGVTVVAEDHCWGARLFDCPVDETQPPISAVARRFHDIPACSLGRSLQDTAAACRRRATQAFADGAIFYVAEQDGVQSWEAVKQIELLERSGTPCLHLKSQRYDGGDISALRSTIRAFIETLRPRS